MTQTSAAVAVFHDGCGAFFYRFHHAGETHEVFDFPSAEEAIKGAQLEVKAIVRGLPHEVADGLGAIYRP